MDAAPAKWVQRINKYQYMLPCRAKSESVLIALFDRDICPRVLGLNNRGISNMTQLQVGERY